MRRAVAVAVPLPLAEPLTYAVPAGMAELVAVGVRVRTPVGRRRLVGVVVEVDVAPPPGVTLRAIEAVLDAEPVLSAELLALAAFAADYYLAPPGEVLRAVLPAGLPAWANRRYRLTDRGALALTRDELEAQVVEQLHTRSGATRNELHAALAAAAPVDPSALAQVLDRMVREGRIAADDEAQRAAARYRSAVELAAGEPEALRARVGRSAAGRAVVDHLLTLGRAASQEELADALGVSAAVLRRLAGLGVLRRFTEVSPLTLDRHRLAGESTPPLVLRAEQESALGAVVERLAAHQFAAFLLHGITGSGKTEVYLRAVAAALAQGRTALVLVPEIALVPALAREVTARFAGNCAILHSNLAAGERAQEWERVRAGGARVVVGPRSAVFAPLANLGLVVVDEEQDSAYKQEVTPRYHGRDLALVRGRQAAAVVLLASATPSLETRLNVERGKVTPLVLASRAGVGQLPEGVLVDLRREPADRNAGPARRGSFSRLLREELAAVLERGEQAILFRNRRGYAPILLCRACGEDGRCEDCGLPRTWHRREARMLCHYCGSSRPVPSRCPACGEATLEAVGTGTERVEEELAEQFPGTAVDVLDRDAVRRVGGPAAVLERFARGESQILVGTQMVSKGHHFPGVALAAVLSADTYLSFPDFRAVERTYTLLTQLAGRAGRGERPGKVVIQTFHPEHYAIRAALDNDDAGFAAEELRFRRVFHYPPYTRMVQLLWSERGRARAEEGMAVLAGRLRSLLATGGAQASQVRITGPAPAPLERLRGEWRFQLLVRAPSAAALHRLLRAALPEGPQQGLTIDVDPQSLL